MPKVTLAVLQPRNAATGATVTVRLSGGGTRGHTYLGQTDWLVGLLPLPATSPLLGFDQLGWTGSGTPAGRELTWQGEKADRDTLAAYFWPGAAVTVYEIEDDGTGQRTLLEGFVDDTPIAPMAESAALVIKCVDAALDLQKPVIDTTFAGTGGVEGGASIAGRPRRRVWGVVRNVELWSFDEANNLWAAADPARAIQGVVATKDGGLAATGVVTVAWAGSVAATIAALAAVNLGNGTVNQAAVAPSIGGMVKWYRSDPVKLTVDLQGSTFAGYSDRPLPIASALLAERAPRNFVVASYNSANAARNFATGLLVDEPSETIAAALDRLLGGVSVWWALTAAGLVDVGTWSWGASQGTLDGYNVERVATYKPHHSRKVGYARNHYQHSKGELAAIVLAANIGGQIDWQSQIGGAGKPENGADVTRTTPWGLGLGGESLVPNGDFSVGAKGWTAIDGTALDAAVSFPATTHGPAMLLGHKVTEYGVLSDRFAVRAGKLHRYTVYTNHNGIGALPGLFARIYWYTDADALIGFDDKIDGNVAVVTGADAVYSYPVIPPANAAYARCAFFNSTQSDAAFTIYDVGVYSYANATPRITLPPGPITVKADYTGTVIAGQLPLNFQARLIAGDYDITNQVAWTRSDFNCVAPISSGGVIELTAVNGNGYIEAIATLGTFQTRDKIAVVKNIADPPPPSAEGGAGATSGQDTNFSAISSSSYSGSADAGPVVVRTNSAGKLRFTCQFSYQRAESTTGSAALAVTPCYRINGAGGFSTSSEVVGSNSTVTLTVIPTEPDYIERVEGYLSYDFVLTGLSANTDYQCWNFHRIGAGSGTLTPIGSFTVQAVS